MTKNKKKKHNFSYVQSVPLLLENQLNAVAARVYSAESALTHGEQEIIAAPKIKVKIGENI